MSERRRGDGDELRVEALGVVIGIDLTGLARADADAVRAAWTGAATASRPSTTVAPRPGPALPARLSQAVTLAAIEHRKGELWMLHACGIALSDGRVLAFVGPSGRGKTTAARALGAVAGYVSDETIGVAADGRILPYRKPLSIVEAGAAAKAQLAPGSLALGVLPDAPLQLSRVVLLDRRPDAPTRPAVEEVELGDAIAELVAQSSHLAAMPAPLRTIAAHVEATGGVARVVYREAETLPDVLPQLVRAPRDVRLAARIEPETSVRTAPDEAAGVRYRRVPAHDAILLPAPERLVLLHGDMVRVLAGVAPAVWHAAAGVGLGTLTAAAVAAYGTPAAGDARSAVARIAAELVEAGVLSSGPSGGSLPEGRDTGPPQA